MAEELVAKPPALMRALDQARDIGDHEFHAIHTHNAQIGMQGGEGIIRDFGPRIRGGCKEGGFACIGHAQKPHIGNQFEAQPDRALYPLLAGIGAARGLIGGGFEMEIAKAAIAALGQKDPLADLGDIGDDGFLIFLEDFGAHRHAQHDIIAILACALLAHAGLAAAREEMLLVAEIDQRVQTVNRFGPDIAAAPAIAAIGAAIFDVFFTPEADAARATAARTDIDLGEIEKFHVITLCAARLEGRLRLAQFPIDRRSSTGQTESRLRSA